jgi:hypothetical protein
MLVDVIAGVRRGLLEESGAWYGYRRQLKSVRVKISTQAKNNRRWRAVEEGAYPRGSCWRLMVETNAAELCAAQFFATYTIVRCATAVRQYQLRRERVG